MSDPRHTALGPRALGLFGRRIWFIRRYPPVLAAHLPVLREFALVVLALWFWSRASGVARRGGGISRPAQMADLLWLGLRQSIDPISYYLFELYLPQRRAETTEYLTRYHTKNGLFAALNRLPLAPYSQRTELTDKLRFADWCERLGIVSPRVLMAADGSGVTGMSDATGLDGDLFVKSRHGSGARGTRLYRLVAPLLYRAPDGTLLSLAQLLETLRVLGAKRPLVVQRRLRNHPELADLAGESLLVVRVMTCLDAQGQPTITDAMLRVLAKLEPEWRRGADDEWVAAVDVGSGKLSQMTGDVPETCAVWHDAHPVTGAVVSGRVLPHWQAVCALALAAHHGFRDRTVIGWDIAITLDGPMIVEGNPNPDVLLIQRVHRAPLGHRPLGWLLHGHFDRLEIAVPAGHEPLPMAPRRLQATALAGLLMAVAIHLHMLGGTNADHNFAELNRAISRVESMNSGYAIEAAPSRHHNKAYTVMVSQLSQDVAFDIDTETGRIITAVVRSEHLPLVGGLYSRMTLRDLSLAGAVAAAERYTGGTAIEAELRGLDPVSYEIELSSARGHLKAIVEGNGNPVVHLVRKRT